MCPCKSETLVIYGLIVLSRSSFLNVIHDPFNNLSNGKKPIFYRQICIWEASMTSAAMLN